MHLSLMDECRSRVEQALAVLGAEPSRARPGNEALMAERREDELAANQPERQETQLSTAADDFAVRVVW
jgi:hypothetical protein